MLLMMCFGFTAITLAQKIQTSNMVYNLPGEERLIYLDEYETANILLYQFGDGNEMLSKGGSSLSGRLVKHRYLKPGNYVAKVFELKDGQQILITADNIKINPLPTKFTVKEVYLIKYNPIKPDGRAWDNAMGGTYPDIFVSYYSGDKLIAKGSIAYDVGPKQLPVLLDKKRQLNLSDFNGSLDVHFYDYDSISSSDHMVGFNINLDPISLLDNKKNEIKFSHNGFVGILTYKLD